MSLFLGKVHYWMYDKIKWFEGIEEDIKKFIDEKAMPKDAWEKEIEEKFSAPCGDKPLETVIDTGNIHGWLSDKIDNAEGRLSVYITKILNENGEYIKDLVEILYEKGKYQGDAKGKITSIENPEGVFNAMNDFVLEGMPCDNVVKVLESTEESIVWMLTDDLHKKFYDDASGDVSNFYLIRDAWKKGFVETIAPGYKYNRVDSSKEEIIKVK